MDFLESLLLPNVMYLLLVGGIWSAALAVVTPGTGVFESLAVLGLGAAGIGTLLIPYNGWALALFALGLLLFGLAVWKRHSIWLLISALLFSLASVFLFGVDGGGVHPLLAVMVSVSTLGFFWISIRQALLAHGGIPAHDLGELIGQVGEVRTDVDLEGAVYVGGELWTARAEAVIKTGSTVRVTGRNGLVLVVEETDRSALNQP